MKKFKFKLKEKNYEVGIVNVEDNFAEVEVNGSIYEIELERNIIQTKTPKLVRSTVSPSTESDSKFAKTSSPALPKGAGLIKSPLPGTVISIAVKEGDLVKIGDRLLILEAMKMENNINSDKEGKVISIKVKQRDSVLEGDVLMEIGG
jgi:glutaconyl-CoA/methylmalonyl-CoA decarboxylase subunit gamma